MSKLIPAESVIFFTSIHGGFELCMRVFSIYKH